MEQIAISTNLEHVLVFRTNITTDADKQRVQPLLGENPGIKDWSVDLEDVDKVLRVVSCTLTPSEIIHLIRQAGFTCDDLE